jgi:hypothetical protein
MIVSDDKVIKQPLNKIWLKNKKIGLFIWKFKIEREQKILISFDETVLEIKEKQRHQYYKKYYDNHKWWS